MAWPEIGFQSLHWHITESWEAAAKLKGRAKYLCCDCTRSMCKGYFSHLQKQYNKWKTPTATATPPPPPCKLQYSLCSKYWGGTHFDGGELALLEFGLRHGGAGWGWAPGRGWGAEESPSSGHGHPWHDQELTMRKKLGSVVWYCKPPSHLD